MLCDGVDWCRTSDYTGLGWPREACGLGRRGIKRLHPEWEMPPIKHLRACDNGTLQQAGLRKIAADFDGDASCVFKDTSDRRSSEVLARLDAMEPSKTSRVSKEVRAQMRKQQREYVTRMRSMLSTVATTSY